MKAQIPVFQIFQGFLSTPEDGRSPESGCEALLSPPLSSAPSSPCSSRSGIFAVLSTGRTCYRQKAFPGSSFCLQCSSLRSARGTDGPLPSFRSVQITRSQPSPDHPVLGSHSDSEQPYLWPASPRDFWSPRPTRQKPASPSTCQRAVLPSVLMVQAHTLGMLIPLPCCLPPDSAPFTPSLPLF